MILVTGAAGKTGRAVIETLVASGQAVRALVHRLEQVGLVEGLGAQDVLVGDMRSPAIMDRAVQGVGAIYHICPNVHPDELGIGETVIAAARKREVRLLVYHSVLHPQVEAMPHHWQKLRVEERLFESGLNWTILQPAAYMQNVLAHWNHVAETGIYPVPYAVETQLSMVDLADLAEAATRVLTDPGHAGATYELAGTEAMSQAEIAEILAESLGRPVRAQVVPIDVWAQQARDAGLSTYQIDTLLQMFRYYEQHGFVGNPRVLGWLLGRPPLTFAACVERATRPRPGGSVGKG